MLGNTTVIPKHEKIKIVAMEKTSCKTLFHNADLDDRTLFVWFKLINFYQPVLPPFSYEC